MRWLRCGWQSVPRALKSFNRLIKSDLLQGPKKRVKESDNNLGIIGQWGWKWEDPILTLIIIITVNCSKLSHFGNIPRKCIRNAEKQGMRRRMVEFVPFIKFLISRQWKLPPKTTPPVMVFTRELFLILINCIGNCFLQSHFTRNCLYDPWTEMPPW